MKYVTIWHYCHFLAFVMSLAHFVGEPAFKFAEAFRNYCFINPFDTGQQRLLGEKLNATPLPDDIPPVPGPAVSDRPELDRTLPWVRGIIEVSMKLIESGKLSLPLEERELLSTLSRGELYFRYRSDFESIVRNDPADVQSTRTLYRRFEKDYRVATNKLQQLVQLSNGDHGNASRLDSPSHAFAIFFQIRRAFGTIRSFINGTSRPANLLRAAMWESVFSTDFQLYGDLLFDRMHDINTLILGPSGTGKELVARTIGSCGYLPYTPSKGFDAMPDEAFRPVNLSEFSPELIESELFGHIAGSFTGATSDRAGVFEGCQNYHTLFLDEIGELDTSIQVKLLRVLQERTFCRVGDNNRRHFGGKVVAATNRDLESEMNEGRFREDFYFRLCADVIRTPSLREQLDDTPDDLPVLVRGICGHVLGTENPKIVDLLEERVLTEIETNPSIGWHYRWPGNFRELEQCVRSTLIHGSYQPTRNPKVDSKPAPSSPPTPADTLAADVRRGTLTWDEILDRYVNLIHQRSKNLTETARRLGKHRSTVQKRLGNLCD